jgi:hypothetical protein
VDPNGGFGKVLGLFLSLILLQLISTGFNLLGFSPHLTQAIWGITMLFAIFIANNVEAGILDAQLVLSSAPKGSDVAIIEGDPGTTSSMERVTGFTNAAKEGGYYFA